jgi:hypothetical protein
VATRKSTKRIGPITDAERELVAQVVLDQPGELRPAQVNGLATALRRSKTAIKELIDDAQSKFRANADFYVDMHRKAVQRAHNDGNQDAAMKGAQWAMERLSAEGSHIIEPKVAEQGGQGPRVMIGIKVGGLDATKEPIEVIATEVKE